jgi:hypothetical protein
MDLDWISLISNRTGEIRKYPVLHWGLGRRLYKQSVRRGKLA